MARLNIDIPDDFIYFTNIPVRKIDTWGEIHVPSHAIVALILEAHFRFWEYCEFKIEDVYGSSMIFGSLQVIFQSEVQPRDTLRFEITVGNFHDYGCDLFFRVMHRDSLAEVAKAQIAMLTFDYSNRKVENLGRAVEFRFDEIPKKKSKVLTKENSESEKETNPPINFSRHIKLDFPKEKEMIIDNIILAAIEVNNELGDNYTENIYRKILIHELGLRDIKTEFSRNTIVTYKNIRLDMQKHQFTVEDFVKVDVKFKDEITFIDENNMLTSLIEENLQVGIIINFKSKNFSKEGIRKVFFARASGENAL